MPSYYVQQLLNALSLGGLYALLALGLGIVFSILNLINFAYGELVAIGGYTMFFLLTKGVSWTIVIPATLFAVIAGSILMERVGFRPVRGASPATLLLTSFAISTILQHSFLITVSPRAQGVPTPGWMSEVISFGSYTIPSVRLLTLGATALCLVGLLFFLRRFDYGIAMRAAAKDFVTVRLMGIRANAVVTLAFGISGALAGVVALLYVARNGVVDPTMGFSLLLKAFIAVVIGGLGSLIGAVIGAFLLAFIEVGLQALLPTNALVFRDALAFALVILLLLFRPEGLMGSRQEGLR
jgi:branched-chain amino acid transport system permease protein